MDNFVLTISNTLEGLMCHIFILLMVILVFVLVLALGFMCLIESIVIKIISIVSERRNAYEHS